MAKHIIDKMIPQALIEAQKFQGSDTDIASKYLSGISSFGTSIISMGLKATLLVYTAKEGKYGAYEAHIVAILNAYLPTPIGKLFTYSDIDKVLDAVTAFKLALRSYGKQGASDV